MAVVEDPRVKRVLVYPVEIRYTVAPHPLAPFLPPAGGDDVANDNDEGSARWRCRVHSLSPPPSSGLAGGDASGHGGCSLGSAAGEWTALGKSQLAASLAACSRLLVPSRVQGDRAWRAPFI